MAASISEAHVLLPPPLPPSPPSAPHSAPPPWRVCLAHINTRTGTIDHPFLSHHPWGFACLGGGRRSAGGGPPSKRNSDAARKNAPLRGRVCCGFVLKHRPVGPMFQRDDVCLGTTPFVFSVLFLPNLLVNWSPSRPVQRRLDCRGRDVIKHQSIQRNPAIYIVTVEGPSYESCQRVPAYRPRSPSPNPSAGEDQEPNKVREITRSHTYSSKPMCR